METGKQGYRETGDRAGHRPECPDLPPEPAQFPLFSVSLFRDLPARICPH